MAIESGFEGGCTCTAVRYRMSRAPLFVHCCHCRWCQRETGTAFALNGLVEASEVSLLQGEVEIIDTPSNSGRGQRISMIWDRKVLITLPLDPEAVRLAAPNYTRNPRGIPPCRSTPTPVSSRVPMPASSS